MTPLIAALLVAAPPPPASVLETLNRTIRLHQVSLSRDGSRVAWVAQEPTPDGPAPDRSFVEVQDLSADAKPRRLTAGKAGESHDEDQPAFSPDGLAVAFLSDAEKPRQPQLYVANLQTGQVRQLTHADGHLEKPRFSPDGKTISLLFVEGGADVLGPLMPASRQTGVVEEKIREQRIAVVPADGSAVLRPISPADLFVYEYAWRPDGGAFVATAAHGSGDDNWWVAQLYVVDSGGAARVLHKPALQICQPVWSPDGARIAFIEGLMSDEGSSGGDVFVMPADGSAKPRNLTPGMRGTATSLRWIAPGLIAGAQIEGDAAFMQVGEGAPPQILWRGAEGISDDRGIGAAFSADGKVSAAVRDSFTQPPEVAAGTVGAWKAITSRNAALQTPAGEARSLTWKSDKREVQGWLLAPPGKPSPGAPMVVIAHGGPAAAFRPGWSEIALLLASQGYYVFMPNPRGSYGQGEAFTRANVRDFGYGDLRDILRGVDAAVGAAGIDPKRVGLFGHSYGGYMAMWAVTQTQKFAAAVASAGLSNWQSYYGENRIDQWMIPYFGHSVYDEPAIYARSSPITFIKNVHTPTLVLHGERDAEVPLGQGQEFWHALKTLGVETQFVVYEDEGHRIRQPAHVRDRIERIVGWFDSHLKAAPVQPSR